MRVLVIKTSSMGDVIHALPALTDAADALPGITVDWVVEEALADIPGWHPVVNSVIPVAIRRWRTAPWRMLQTGEWRRFKSRLQAHKYDAILDAQGLLKSALLARLAYGPIYGLDRRSAREPLAAYLYHHPQTVSWQQHAVERIRQLFAQALGYRLPDSPGRFLLAKNRFVASDYAESPYVVFIHGTTRPDKHWPEPYWCQLAALVNAAGYTVLLPWGNATERARATRIAQATRQATVLPHTSLTALAGLLAKAAGVVAVDTGLGHLAAALGKTTVSLYGPTCPGQIGTYGVGQIHLTLDACPLQQHHLTVEPAAFAAMTPAWVWSYLAQSLSACS